VQQFPISLRFACDCVLVDSIVIPIFVKLALQQIRLLDLLGVHFCQIGLDLEFIDAVDIFKHLFFSVGIFDPLLLIFLRQSLEETIISEQSTFGLCHCTHGAITVPSLFFPEFVS